MKIKVLQDICPAAFYMTARNESREETRAVRLNIRERFLEKMKG